MSLNLARVKLGQSDLTSVELRPPSGCSSIVHGEEGSVFRSHEVADVLAHEVDEKLVDVLLELLEGQVLLAGDQGERPSVDDFVSSLDAWLDGIGVAWEDTVPVDREIPLRLVKAAAEALSELYEHSDGEHAPEPPPRVLRDVSAGLIDGARGPAGRSEREAVAWLLEAAISERWDPWPEEVDGRFLAAVLYRHWGGGSGSR